jgi:hypothetical protein
MRSDILVMDGGNKGNRAMRPIAPDTVIVNKKVAILPNAVYKHHSMPESDGIDTTWSNRGDSVTFGLRKGSVSGFYTVGSAAEEHRNSFSFVGTDKFYDEGYLSILVASNLANNFASAKNKDGEEFDIALGVMHPYDYMGEGVKKIRKIVKGTYAIQFLDGRKMKFNVTPYTLPETVGAAMWVNPNTLFGHAVAKNRFVVYFDIGFGTTDVMVYDYGENRVIGDVYRTFDIGARDYVNQLSRHLAVSHKSQLGTIGDRVSVDYRIFEAMRTGFYPIDAGEFIDVTDFVQKMKDDFVRHFDARWKADRFTQQIDVIVGVGGAASFFLEGVVNRVFPKFNWGHNAKLANEDVTASRLINVHGFAKKIEGWVNNAR